MARPDRFWDVDLGILRIPSWSEQKPGFHVVARDRDGSVVGVARYECEEKWEHRIGRSEVKVTLFVTSGPVGDALLWEHLVTLDHLAQVQVEDRGPDELLPWLLTNARHARPIDRADFLWIRPLDVAEVLAARTYLVAGGVVLEVVDASGLTAGRFALEGGPDGAVCRPSDASPDLTLDVSTLSSIYLGGYRARRLAAAGFIDEHSSGAVATADAMFRSPVAPWCSTWF
jgi:predicted acetyltransferase